MLVPPLPSANSSFDQKRVATETKWRSRENGGCSFRLRNTWNKNKVALVYDWSHELETFLLVFEVEGNRGDDTAVIMCFVPNDENPSVV